MGLEGSHRSGGAPDASFRRGERPGGGRPGAAAVIRRAAAQLLYRHHPHRTLHPDDLASLADIANFPSLARRTAEKFARHTSDVHSFLETSAGSRSAFVRLPCLDVPKRLMALDHPTLDADAFSMTVLVFVVTHRFFPFFASST